jgi:cystathionine beta-lyase/cystathionine gamma-synthase
VIVPDGFQSLVPPTYRGSTTLFANAASVKDTWDHNEAAYTYGLYGTPTTLELAARIAELEGGYRTFITPGGQAALALIYFSFVNSGDHALVPDSIYGPNRALAEDVLRRYNVEVTYYDPLSGSGIEPLIKGNTRLIWALRGLQTLAIRLKAIEQSALAVAQWLTSQPSVKVVLHPALPSCPGHEIWKRDFDGSTASFQWFSTTASKPRASSNCWIALSFSRSAIAGVA